MKLATYKDGSRDGQLVVVSRDLARAHFATGIATRLQQVLDDWNYLAPQLQQLSDTLHRGALRHAFDFDPRLCAAPLPRAFQVAWCTAGAEAPELLAGDALAGARDDAQFASDGWEVDAEAGLALLTGDVAAGTPADAAGEGVRLLALMARWRLRAPGMDLPALAPAPAIGPVAVTPDELGEAWRGGRLALALQVHWNQRLLGRRDAALALPWSAGQALARLAHARALQAGSVVGLGAAGEAEDLFSLQALRAQEAAGDAGAPRTAFARHGDRLRVALLDAAERAPLGHIEQAVAIGRG